jgi:cell volume regulation protein A
MCRGGHGREDFLHKRSILAFYDGLAWLMQIVMFLVLVCWSFPATSALSFCLGWLWRWTGVHRRPLAVMLSLSLTQFKFNEKVFISWVGLRGAVPIILATYPRVMGIQPATDIFNIVFSW